LANTPIGTKGGIITFWKKSKFDLISSLDNHDSMIVIFIIIANNNSIFITNIFSLHKVTDHIKILKILSNLLDPLHHPLKIIVGDFKIITNFSEKKGGIWKLDKDFEYFLTAIEKINLIDIPMR